MSALRVKKRVANETALEQMAAASSKSIPHAIITLQSKCSTLCYKVTSSKGLYRAGTSSHFNLSILQVSFAFLTYILSCWLNPAGGVSCLSRCQHFVTTLVFKSVSEQKAILSCIHFLFNNDSVCHQLMTATYFFFQTNDFCSSYMPSVKLYF